MAEPRLAEGAQLSGHLLGRAVQHDLVAERAVGIVTQNPAGFGALDGLLEVMAVTPDSSR